MNRKHVLSVTGRILQLMSILLLLPTVVSIIYGESSFWSFIITSLLSLALGLLLRSFSHTHNHTIYAREGFLIVALAWLSISVIGALPFGKTKYSISKLVILILYRIQDIKSILIKTLY